MRCLLLINIVVYYLFIVVYYLFIIIVVVVCSLLLIDWQLSEKIDFESIDFEFELTYINCMYCINVLILLINIIDYYPRAVAMCEIRKGKWNITWSLWANQRAAQSVCN